MSYLVADLNRHLFTIWVGFLPPEPPASDASKTSSGSQRHSKPSIPAMEFMRKRDHGDFEKDKHAVNAARSKEQARINSDHSAERSRARNLSEAVRQRIAEQSAPSKMYTEQSVPESPTQPHPPAEPQRHVLPSTEDFLTVPVAIAPLLRQSNRSQTHKRTRYEPARFGSKEAPEEPTSSNRVSKAISTLARSRNRSIKRAKVCGQVAVVGTYSGLKSRVYFWCLRAHEILPRNFWNSWCW
jgi:hypothetical protein